MKNKHIKEIELWKNSLTISKQFDYLRELDKVESIYSTEEIHAAFSKDLVFGTGGVRQKMGLGSNRINLFTISKITYGIGKYLKAINGPHKTIKVVIGYDTRNNSKKFAQCVGGVLNTFGITSYIFPIALPTPMVSFAIRELQADLGVMITASHNDATYNGYKVYDSNGIQATDNLAAALSKYITSVNIYKLIEYSGDFLETILTQNLPQVPKNVIERYYSSVITTVRKFINSESKSLNILYTPLNGTGFFPVTRVLHESGFYNLSFVQSQAFPDEQFITCPSPNPEYDSAYKEALMIAKELNPDVIIATDPDCDRVSVMVRSEGAYHHLSGDELGILILDYLIKRLHPDKMNSVVIKTIVTSQLINRMCEKNKITVIETLTGFKYIGEQLERISTGNKEFLLGVEESCGYLIGDYVRDKDGVVGSLLVSSVLSALKDQGISPLERLNDIYTQYGFITTSQLSIDTNNEVSGLNANQVYHELCDNDKIDNLRVETFIDYNDGIDGLPSSDVVKVVLEHNNSIIIRPSGTEPKVKIYITSLQKSAPESEMMINRLKEYISSKLITTRNELN